MASQAARRPSVSVRLVLRGPPQVLGPSTASCLTPLALLSARVPPQLRKFYQQERGDPLQRRRHRGFRHGVQRGEEGRHHCRCRDRGRPPPRILTRTRAEFDFGLELWGGGRPGDDFLPLRSLALRPAHGNALCNWLNDSESPWLLKPAAASVIALAHSAAHLAIGLLSRSYPLPFTVVGHPGRPFAQFFF